MSEETIGYKLTNEKNQTRGGCQWGEGITHESPGTDELCTDGWLHYYRHPLLAVLHNPIHGDFENPVLWECRIEETIKHDGWMKSGCSKLTTLRKIDCPVVTTEQVVRYGICCAWSVYDDSGWREWATKWLCGEDRSEDAARVARAAASAAWTALMARNAARVARAAASGAWTALMARNAARAARNAAWTAWDAASAAMSAVWAARDAETLNLIACAKWAMGNELVPCLEGPE